MKTFMKKVIGWAILSLLAIGFVTIVSVSLGFWKALGIIALTIIITALLIGAVFLIVDD